MSDIVHAETSRDGLLAQCTLAFVKSALPALASDERGGVILVIARRNILSGRAGRWIRRQRLARSAHPLVSYLQSVARHYASERTEWKDLHRRSRQSDLYEILLTSAKSAGLRYRYSNDERLPEDIANEAFVLAICEQRLARYPFDVPLKEWLRDFTSLCAQRLMRQDVPKGQTLISLSYIAEESELSLADSCQCGRQPCTCNDRTIDITRHITSMSRINQAIIDLWRKGFSIGETAIRLKLSAAAVANRRTRIAQALRSIEKR